MARTRWPSDLGTPASCPGQADQTGSAGGCQKNLGAADRSFPKTTSGVSRLAGQAGPRPPTLRSNRSKLRKQGRSTIHILPAEYALPGDDEFAMAKLHRTASSGAVSPVLPSPAPASHAYSTLWPVAASCPGGSESMGTRAIGSVRAVSRSA